ncbi:MAG TPA: hypothetical protein VM901_07485 [Bdellovibrionota bacterium]|jgi:hypothetical protein|nr:hypothetical protein [Bdellovibrionota bacterium]
MKTIGYMLHTMALSTTLAFAQYPHVVPEKMVNANIARGSREDFFRCISHYHGDLAKSVPRQVREKLTTRVSAIKNFDGSYWLVDRSLINEGLVRFMNADGGNIAIDIANVPQPTSNMGSLVRFEWDGKRRDAMITRSSGSSNDFLMTGGGVSSKEDWQYIGNNSFGVKTQDAQWQPDFNEIALAYLAYTTDFIDSVRKKYPGITSAGGTDEEKTVRANVKSMIRDCRKVRGFNESMNQIRSDLRL